MKRLTIAGIFIGLSLLLSGCFAVESYYQWKYAREKEEIIQIVESEEADLLIKDFLKNYDKNAFTPSGKIQSYTIDYDSLKYVPTGSISIIYYINGDPMLYLNCLIKKNKHGKLTVIAGGHSKELEVLDDE